MGKYLSLDIGDVRIGVAVSDANNKFSLPLEVIDRNKVKAYKRIKEICIEKDITDIVVGLPLRLNGNSEVQVEKIKLFVEKLRTIIKNVNYHYFDERYTTKLAENNLKIVKKNSKESRKVVDMIAANIILQDFLDLKNKIF